MSVTIREAFAQDGSKYPYIDDGAPKQGGMKEVYFAPDRSYVVAFYKKTPPPVAIRRLEKIVGEYRRAIFEDYPNEGAYWQKLFCWPEKIVERAGKIGILMPTYSQNFFFDEAAGCRKGKEKEGLWFASAHLFNRVLPAVEKGSLDRFLRVCWKLSSATRRLHAAGLAHSDLSYKNCLVSPRHGDACIIDLDGLVVPDLYPPDVLGSNDFLAPEVVSTRHLPLDDPERKLPCRETDRHALAVMHYLLLFHRHPLRGNQFFSSDPDEQERMQMGAHSLFIEDPVDASNRSTQLNERELPWCDAESLPYDLAGPELAPLFRRAFVDGLHDPAKRPTADDWERAFVRTFDLVLPCSNPECVKKGFVYDGSASQAVCPYCGTPYVNTVPILEFFVTRNGDAYLPENRRLTARHNQWLNLWHVNPRVAPNEKLAEADLNGVAYISFYKGRWYLVNQTLPNMRNLTDGVDAPPQTKVELRDGLELLLRPGADGRKIRVRIANRPA